MYIVHCVRSKYLNVDSAMMKRKEASMLMMEPLDISEGVGMTDSDSASGMRFHWHSTMWSMSYLNNASENEV